jgi:hypothetical protein
VLDMDVERRLAIAKLLEQPDPPGLRRQHHLRVEGKPDRYELVPLLSAAFVQAKLLELHERRAEETAGSGARVRVAVAQRALRHVTVAA